MKKNPAEKKLNAGSLKNLKSRIGPGSRRGKRLLRKKLHKMRTGRFASATVRTAQANPMFGLLSIFDITIGHTYYQR
jgi:hypothetical protein